MPWPPTLPPTGRTNDTPTRDAHPSDHNAIAAALADIVARITANETAVARLAPLAYVEGTANVNVTANSSTAAQTVIATPSIALDGSPVIVEFYCPFIITPPSGGQTYSVLYDGSTDLGYVSGTQVGGASAGGGPGFIRRRLTPAAGSHTFSIRGFVLPGGAAAGTYTGGPGGAAIWNPMVLTVRYA